MIADVVDFHRFAPLNTRDLLTAYPGKGLYRFGDETVDPRRDDRQRYRAELEHRIVESAARNTAQSRSSYSSAAGTTATTDNLRIYAS